MCFSNKNQKGDESFIFFNSINIEEKVEGEQMIIDNIILFPKTLALVLSLNQ